MTSIAPYAKAIIGALIAGLASLQQALDDGSVSAQEWTGVVIATLSGLALIWAIPNKDPQDAHQDESVQPPKPNQFGYGALELIVGVVALVILILVLVRLV